MPVIVDENIENERIRTEMVQANRLNFEVSMCGEGRKLALCLHGFPEHSFSWRYQLPMLADLGYKAWAPNMRGYGNSSKPPFVEDYSIEHLMDDVAALIDAADCDETVLIAHDWGAVIAWYFAMRQKRPLSRLIICNVPHPVPAGRVMWRKLGQLKRSWYIFFFQLPGLPEWLMRRKSARPVAEAIRNTSVDKSQFPDEVIEVYRRNAAQPGALRSMVNYYRALVRGGGARRQASLGYPVIEVPTLMIWGEEDIALTKETTYGTDKYVRHLTIRYLPRVSHWVQQEVPEVVNEMIKAFLNDEPVPELEWQATLRAPD
ncbi:MAG: alpha/beta hydrolase [Pseudomonadales bacterium]